MNGKYAITLNSAIIYVFAFLLTTVIHEFLHALIGLYFHSGPVIHHNYVEHLSPELLNSNQKVSIALAGPIISLLQGILTAMVYFNIRKQPHRLIHLFLLWFSVLGLFNFLGYLMTGLLFKKGDIGKVYDIMNTPFSLQILLAIISAIFLVFIAYKMTKPYLKFSYNKKWVENGKARKNFSFRVLFLPWIIGSITVTILYLPIISLISIVYPIMSGMIFIFPWQNSEAVTEVNTSVNNETAKLSLLWLVLLVFLIFVFRIILTPGIKLQ